ncbi:MAG: NAD(P)H-quinone oxidoreductase subunit L [Hormoscilla sp.]
MDDNSLTLLVYGGLAGAYLLVVPLLLFFYLKLRWYSCSSIERLLMYSGVFLFFPGLLLLAPLLNLRPRRRPIAG